MCGIAGFLNLDGSPASLVLLRSMTDAVRHRGPDGEGHFIDGAFALGHRRLAILDLSPAGHQPMMTCNGRYVLSYNGELYNFQELRIELEARGYQFRSTGDSEVVLNALAEWGEGALLRFNGMFALALWDREERILLLARDRYGIKPLYYGRSPSVFAFGSEVKALLPQSSISSKIDQEGLVEYLTFQNFFTERTIFAGVKLLPPASILRIGPEGRVHVRAYWDYQFREPSSPLTEEDAVAELDYLFRQAVNRQLVSDVEIGAYLSGGMDSGAITAIASSQHPYIKSFTCGFDLSSASGMELSFDERAAAERMSYQFKTEHYEMVLKSGDMERVMQRLVWHLEEPRVGQCYPIFYAAKLAGKFVKVVLSGTGGDEIFAGYPWRYYRAVRNDNFEHYVSQYYEFWQRLISDEQKPEIMKPIWAPTQHGVTRDIFQKVLASQRCEHLRPEDYINCSLYLEARTFLHGLLVVEDKMSMAHSLETRVPFLDNDLVDFAMSIPASQKLGNLAQVARLNENDIIGKREQYFRRFRDGKLLLRKMMQNYVPHDIANGEKQGFSGPDGAWFKGESIEYVRRLLYNHNARLYDYLDRRSVQALVNEHLRGQANRRLLIWSLIYLENLMQIFAKAMPSVEQPAPALTQQAASTVLGLPGVVAQERAAEASRKQGSYADERPHIRIQ
jgi:asparagine synthase (glutamine-hydrolysing)